MRHDGPEGELLAVHVGALRAAGFAEVGTIWQRGSNRVLAAVRLHEDPAPPDLPDALALVRQLAKLNP